MNRAKVIASLKALIPGAHAADWQNVEGVYYEKGESGWAYVQTDTTHISA